MSESKECFVICPIGSNGTDTRERSDKLMEHIVDPVVSEYGYESTRAHTITEPGSITTQVIEKTVESELVIADLTNHNPNVFYELAVRHATGKPYIQLIDSSESVPFDISDIRTIYYDFDVESANRATEEIRAQIETIEQEGAETSNPISRAADLKFWRESEDPIQQNLAEITDSISQLNNRLAKIERAFEVQLRRASQTLYSFETNDPPKFELTKEDLEKQGFDSKDFRNFLKHLSGTESEDE